MEKARALLRMLLLAASLAILAIYGWHALVEHIDTRTHEHFDGFGRLIEKHWWAPNDWRMPPLVTMWIDLLWIGAAAGVFAIRRCLKGTHD